MRLILILSFIACFVFSTGLRAEDAAPLKKKMVTIFREDSGLTKAEAQLRDEKYTEALDTLEAVLTRHPNNADALTYMGYAYIQLGDTAKATELLDNALLVNPQHLGANKYRADLYLEAGDTARAMEQLQVIRMVCGGADCAEINALQAAINKSHPKEKKNSSTEPSSQ